MSALPEPSSFEYAPNKEVLIWLPPHKKAEALPLMFFFHGGGLTKGLGDNRQILQAHRKWQIDMAMSHGVALASPSYSLMPDHNATDILNDIDVLWTWFKSKKEFDMSRVGVTGSSAGCFVADQICIRQSPRPKAIGRQWGMAGDLLSDFWVRPHESTPEYIADLDKGNFLVKRLLEGDFLDAFSGQSGLSKTLQAVPEDERGDKVPSHLRKLFPQLKLSPSFPPTAMVHGTGDTIVPVAETIKRADALRKLGVKVQLELVEGGEHGLTKGVEPEDEVQRKRERMVSFVLDEMLA